MSRQGWLRWSPALAVVVAAAVGAAAWRAGGDDGPRTPPTPPPVAVSSNAPRLGSLAELVAASDVVVRGRVVGTARGRVFGDPGSDATIESRVLTLRIDRVLHGAVPGPAEVLVEEEGWDDEGALLVVDGAAPSRAGDDGIWFLTSVGTGEEHRYVVVSAEGRYLTAGPAGAALRGATGDDPLVARLAALGPDGLATAVAALP